MALTPLANAGLIEKAQSAAQQQSWSAWGGDIGIRWNPTLLDNLGLLVQANGQTTQQDGRHHVWFPLRQTGGLQFKVRNDALQSFTGGSLQMRGGYTIGLRDGSTIDLRDLTLRVNAKDSNVLDVVSSDGKVWFYTDRIMFELADNNHTLAIRAADLRITPALAARIGAPESAGWEIADMAFNTQVTVAGSNEPIAVNGRVCTPFPWPNVDVPGVPGAKYQGDLFMQTFSVTTVGCLSCNGTTGTASFAPTSSLINNRNNGSLVATVPGDPLGTSTALYTGNIAWYTKFTGSPPNYNEPYKNDQHPYLIWNMYRVNADGSIEQIGRSGVKHAFLTINAGCEDSCNNSHSLGLGCGDTYGSGNNDSPWDMGPRSEIVAATGIWGRCGSIWDPSCTGQDNGNNGNDTWTQRMKVIESQLDPTANPGATYKFESWYVARDDINILNSMATTTVVPHYNSGSHTWSLSQSGYRLGPAIDRWVDPSSPGTSAMNSSITNGEGHAKVAVKVTDNGNGTWTYNYAVMNLDFARAIVQAQTNGPDPRVVSNKGFDSFSVPIPAGATVSATQFRNGNTGNTGAWTASVGSNAVTWSAGSQPTLDWGTMYSFSMTVNASPRPSTPSPTSRGGGAVSLHVANSGSPAAYITASLVPQRIAN